jgi:hypothetical protein
MPVSYDDDPDMEYLVQLVDCAVYPPVQEEEQNPDKRLRIAVLDRLIRDCFDPNPFIAKEAVRIVRGQKSPERTDLFTFEQLCESVNFEVVAVRESILAILKEKGLN